MDLHIHTTLSDGAKKPIEILDMAQKLGLEYISITDHNNCFAYEELERIDIKEHFNGKLIVGVELMSCFEGMAIEILGYGVDYHIINEWVRNKYSKEQINIKDKTLFTKLKTILQSNPNIKLSENLELPNEIPYEGYFKYMVYNDIIKYKDNKKFLQDNNITSYEKFLMIGLSKKISPIYLEQNEFLVNTKEIIDLIHRAGGLAFLAHVYKYQIENHTKLLQELVDKNVGLDGIEANYSSFNFNQQKLIEEFTKKNNLYCSGGSDYHGKDGRTETIGYGVEGKRIPRSYIEEWYNLIS